MASAASGAVTGGEGVSRATSRSASGVTRPFGRVAVSGRGDENPARSDQIWRGHEVLPEPRLAASTTHLEVGGVVLVCHPADREQRDGFAVDDALERHRLGGRPADRGHLELRRQQRRGHCRARRSARRDRRSAPAPPGGPASARRPAAWAASPGTRRLAANAAGARPSYSGLARQVVQRDAVEQDHRGGRHPLRHPDPQRQGGGAGHHGQADGRVVGETGVLPQDQAPDVTWDGMNRLTDRPFASRL